MGQLIDKGSWVEIHRIVLPADKRAEHIPDDTRRVPFELRVKGFLVESAAVGDEVEIVTPVGRRVRGRLDAVNPPYDHSFGRPIPALKTLGGELRAVLRARGRAR